MANLHFNNINVAGLAGAVPENVQVIDRDPNHPRASYIASYIKQTGITQRHISLTEQTSVDLGYVALKKALKMANWDIDSLDGLVFLTQTPDFNNATGNSFLLHRHLGMRDDTIVFDIAQGCASFPYGLSVCAGFLQQPGINRIAMICGDTLWGGFSSPETIAAEDTFLIGEGTTAVLLEKKGDSSVDIALYGDGNGYHFLYAPWGGCRNAWRHTPGLMPGGEVFSGGGMYMDGMEITSFATLRVVDSIKSFLSRNGKTIDDYDALILHQANRQIVKTMARRLKAKNVPTSMDRFANTNGASVTLTIIDAFAQCEKKRLELLISAFGIGLSWGIVGMSIDPSVIVPMIMTNHRFDDDFLRPLP